MGLKVRLAWYNKNTEYGEGKEDSKELGDDTSVMDQLNLSVDNDMNNGSFDVKIDWLNILQPLFVHRIDLNIYNYQVSFNYRD
ncbi:colicin E3-like toxin immunity protein [Pseudomonas helleri]|jgi:hypothetical protein|uniref:colicin E3-like toxin immunity protein n=1 Tax=Pseudomonas helleri TaxID=1608996 RepID=UPI003D0E3C37